MTIQIRRPGLPLSHGRSRRIYFILPVICIILQACIFFKLQAQVTRYVGIGGNDHGGANSCADPNDVCRSIAQAVSAASAGDVIMVGHGIYTESISIGKSLTLIGSGQGITIIQSHMEPWTASERVVTIMDAPTVNISGVTIRHGKPIESGGGIRISGGGNLSLSNVTISENQTSFDGGGLSSLGASLTLTDVRFIGNRSTFIAGGISIGGGSAVLKNVSLLGNSATGASGSLYTSNNAPVLINVVISGNIAAGDGGGMYLFQSSPVLINTTITGNSAGGSGGGIFATSSSTPTLINTIIWNNLAGEGSSVYTDNSTPHIMHSLVSGSGGSGDGWNDEIGEDGGGNIDEDPLFVSAPDPGDAPTIAGDLQLLTGSPAIDAGTSLPYQQGAQAEGITLDIAGNSRSSGVAVDIGAYEFQHSQTRIDPLLPDQIPHTVTMYQNYPNPFNPSTVIRFFLPENADVKLTVFDRLGRQVAVLVNGRRQSGVHEAVFNAGDLAGGVYLYRLRIKSSTESGGDAVIRSGKMSLIK